MRTKLSSLLASSVLAPAWKPLQLPEGQAVKEVLTSREVVVGGAQAADAKSLVTSSAPLMAKPADSDELAPVDLELKEQAGAFVAVNPVTDVLIPGDPGKAATLPGFGISLQAGPMAVVGSPAGKIAGEAKDKVFYANVAADTDLITGPLVGGVQSSWALRSPLSPERFTLQVGLPSGAKLTGADDGSAAITDADSKRIAVLQPPAAWDAQARPLPVSVSVNGTVLSYALAHRTADVAYPVVLDPSMVVENYQLDGNGNQTAGPSFAGWQVFSPGTTTPLVTSQNGSSYGRGLYVYSETGPTKLYTKDQYTQWAYTAPGTTFIERADFGYVTHEASGSQVFESLFSARDNRFEPSYWQERTGGPGSSPWYSSLPQSGNYKAHCVGTLNSPGRSCVPHANGDPSGTPGNIAVFGLKMSSSGTRSSRALGFMGGSSIWLSDDDNPTVPRIDPPTRFLAGDVKVPVTVSASDTGVGMRYFNLFSFRADGSPIIQTSDSKCRSTPVPAGNGTSPDGVTGTPCPRDAANTFELSTAELPEGERTISAQGFDVITHGTGALSSIRVDRTPPAKPTISSTLPRNSLVPATKTSYRIDVDGTDGSNASPEQKRSGIKRLEIFVDNKVEYYVEQECPAGSCPMHASWTLNTAQFKAGGHSIRAAAVDQLDHSIQGDSQDFTIAAPVVADGADGGQLGLENWLSYDSTSTGAGGAAHVNLGTGNLVWHKVPVVNPGRGLSTVMNLTYNSYDKPRTVIDRIGEYVLDGAVSEPDRRRAMRDYAEVGPNFSLGISGLTRLNEPLGVPTPGPIRPLAQIIGQVPVVDQYDTRPVFLTDPDGTRHVFQARGDGSYISPPGVFLRLRRYSTSDQSKTWAMTRPDGITYFYDPVGNATSVQDRDNNEIRYEYELYTRYRLPAAAEPLAASAVPGSPISNVSRCSGIAAAAGPLPPEDGVFCQRRVKRVVDPAGNRPHKTDDPASTADARAVTVDYLPYRTLEELQPITGQIESIAGPLSQPLAEPGARRGIDGRISTVTDHAQRRYRFQYDERGELTSLTEAAGATDPLGRGNETEERLTRFQWQGPEADRELMSVGEPKSGRPTRFVFGNPQVRPLPSDGTAVQPVTDTRTEPFNTEPCPATVGSTTQAQVTNNLNPLTGIVNRRGKSRLFTRFSCRRSTQVIVRQAVDQAQGFRNSTIFLDDRGRTRTTVDALDRKTVVDYTNLDNQVVQIVSAADSADEALERMTYDANGLLLSRTDYTARVNRNQLNPPSARTTRFEYRQSAGTLTAPSDAGGGFVSDLLSITPPEQARRVSYSVDSRGHQTAQSDGEGGTATTTFDRDGLIQVECDEVGQCTAYDDYDPNGMPRTVLQPENRRWTYAYDAVGNALSVIDPRGKPADIGAAAGRKPFKTQVTYDAFDQPVRQVLPKDSRNGQFITLDRDYDANGNLTLDIDGTLKATTVTYSESDRPLTVSKPGERDDAPEVSEYRYNDADELTTRIDPKGRGRQDEFSTDYTLDKVGRRIAETRYGSAARADGTLQASRKITTYRFDARDNVLLMRDPARNGSDVSDALASINAPDAAQGARWANVYDQVDQLVDSYQRHGTGSGRESDRREQRTHHEYDFNGNRVKTQTPRYFTETPPDGSQEAAFRADRVSLTRYNNRDEVIETRQGEPDAEGADQGAATDRITRITRRADGKPVAVTSPKGVGQGARVDGPDEGGEVGSSDPFKYFTTRYDYYETGELKSRSIPYSPGQYGDEENVAAWKVSYGRDKAGDPVSITDARGNTFTNQFLDTGDLISTTRPSWWNLDWGNGAGVPQGGKKYRGPAAAADTAIAEGGPALSEAGPGGNEQSATGLPENDVTGNFGAVATEQLNDGMPAAGLTKLGYDDELRITSITDVANSRRAIDYSPAGRVIAKRYPFTDGEVDDPQTIEHEFSYDPHGNLLSTIDGEFLDAPASITTDRYDLKTTWRYDGFDRPVRQTAPGAADKQGGEIVDEISTYQYDLSDNLRTLTTPRSNSRRAAAQPGVELSFGYDTLDRLISETNPSGNEWTYGYDAEDQLVRDRSPRGNAAASQGEKAKFDTKYAFTAFGELATETDRLGFTSTNEYDPDGNQTYATTPGASRGLDDQGRELPVLDYNTTTTYDGRGLPYRTTVGGITNPDGAITGGRPTVTEYDPNGNLRRTVDARGLDHDKGDTPFNRDEGELETGVAAAAEHATVNVHDKDDLLTATYHPWGKKDDRDRRRVLQRWERDERGWVINNIGLHDIGDTRAPRTSYKHNLAGWIRSASVEQVTGTDAQGTNDEELITYDYDQQGHQVTWSSKYAGTDSRGRQGERRYFPNGTLRSRTAIKTTGDGTPKDEDRLSARRYLYYYNENRSLVELQDNDPTKVGGEPNQNTNPIRVTRIDVDLSERATRVNETWASGKDTVFSYDRDGNVTSRVNDVVTSGSALADGYNGELTGPEKKKTGFTYDRLGQATAMDVFQGDLTQPDRRTEKDYFPSGQVQEKRNPNGLEELSFYTDQGEIARRLRRKDNTSSIGAQAKKDQAVAYDEVGNRVGDERGTHKFNARDQLVEWQRGAKQKKPGTTVKYLLTPSGATEKKDDDGKVTTNTFRGNRLLRSEDAESVTDFAYDDFGSVIRSKTKLKQPNTVLPPAGQGLATPANCAEPEADRTGLTSYCFDEFERPIYQQGPGADSPAVLRYDGLDRRDTKTVKTGASSERVLDYGYVGLSRLLSLERTNENSTSGTRAYDYDESGQRQGVESTGATARKFRTYALDANGSVEGLENASGDVKDTASDTDTYRYDPYGELENESGLSADASQNPFRFEGFYYDTGVKSYDMQARSYRPDIGRFISQDRFSSAGGDYNLQSDPLTQNRYAFAGGNPINNVETNGHYAPIVDGAPGAPLDGGKFTSTEKKRASGIANQRATSRRNSTTTTLNRAADNAGLQRGTPERRRFIGIQRVEQRFDPAGNVADDANRSPAQTKELERPVDEAPPREDTPPGSEDKGYWDYWKELNGDSPGSAALGAVNPLKKFKLGARALRSGGNRLLQKLAGGAAKTGRGGVGPVLVGQAGEAAVRGAYNIGPKATRVIGGRTRIFDGFTSSTVSEVKNVKSLSYTQQLKDSATFAKQSGRRFDLYIRGGNRPTTLSGPLATAIRNGDVQLKYIP